MKMNELCEINEWCVYEWVVFNWINDDYVNEVKVFKWVNDVYMNEWMKFCVIEWMVCLNDKWMMFKCVNYVYCIWITNVQTNQWSGNELIMHRWMSDWMNK